MAYTLTLTFPGESATDVSALLRPNTWRIEETLLNHEFRHVPSTFRATLVDDTTIRDKIINLSDDGYIEVVFSDSGTPLFAGMLRPTTTANISNAQDLIELDAIDFTDLLDVEVGEAIISDADWRVCDTTDTSNSLVHVLLALVTSRTIEVEDGQTLPTCGLVGVSFDARIKDVISDLAFEYGYSYRFTPAGEIRFESWNVDTTTTTATIADPADGQGTLVDGSLKVTRDDKPEDSVKLTWRQIGLAEGRALWESGASVMGPRWFLNGETCPEDSDKYDNDQIEMAFDGSRGTATTLDDWEAVKILPAYFDYDAWLNIDAHNGYTYSTLSREKIGSFPVSADNVGDRVLAMSEYFNQAGNTKTVYVTLDEFDQVGPSTLKIQLTVGHVNGEGSRPCAVYFKSLILRGSVWYRKAVAFIYADGPKSTHKQIESKYISDAAKAEQLANALLGNLYTSKVWLSFSSSQRYELGQNIEIDLSNLDVTFAVSSAKISHREYDRATRLYAYEAKALAEVTAPTPDVYPLPQPPVNPVTAPEPSATTPEPAQPVAGPPSAGSDPAAFTNATYDGDEAMGQSRDTEGRCAVWALVASPYTKSIVVDGHVYTDSDGTLDAAMNTAGEVIETMRLVAEDKLFVQTDGPNYYLATLDTSGYDITDCADVGASRSGYATQTVVLPTTDPADVFDLIELDTDGSNWWFQRQTSGAPVQISPNFPVDSDQWYTMPLIVPCFDGWLVSVGGTLTGSSLLWYYTEDFINLDSRTPTIAQGFGDQSSQLWRQAVLCRSNHFVHVDWSTGGAFVSDDGLTTADGLNLLDTVDTAWGSLAIDPNGGIWYYDADTATSPYALKLWYKGEVFDRGADAETYPTRFKTWGAYGSSWALYGKSANGDADNVKGLEIEVWSEQVLVDGVHGATSAATPLTYVVRDAEGQAQFADPTDDQDAATKAYVDDAIAGAGGGFLEKYVKLELGASDPSHDIKFNPGVLFDDTDDAKMELTSALTKQLDATWAAGDAAGGRFSGSLAAGWWWCWLIQKSSDSTVDCGFSDSASPTLPTGYDRKRYLGRVYYDGSVVRPFDQVGKRFLYRAVVVDIAVSTTLPNTTRNLKTISAPKGTIVILTARLALGSTARVWVKPTSYTDAAASDSNQDLICGSSASIGRLEVALDSSGQLAYRGDSSSAQFGILTQGYIDFDVGGAGA